MKKSAIIWLVAGFLLVFTGVVVFVTSLAIANGDISAVFDSDYITNTVEIKKGFSDIKIYADTEDIVFALSDDGKTEVAFYESKNKKHTAKVIDNTLTVEQESKKEWYDYITFFSLGTEKITVYLPQKSYNSLLIKGGTCDVKLKDLSAKEFKIAVSTGNINAKGIACDGEMNISVSTGNAALENVSCGSLSSAGSTGNIALKNVICGEKMTVSRSTGDVTFEKSDAKEILIKTSTGDVFGTLLSEKIFITDTSTGSVDVPKTESGGKCKITTSTGDITVKIP